MLQISCKAVDRFNNDHCELLLFGICYQLFQGRAVECTATVISVVITGLYDCPTVLFSKFHIALRDVPLSGDGVILRYFTLLLFGDSGIDCANVRLCIFFIRNYHLVPPIVSLDFRPEIEYTLRSRYYQIAMYKIAGETCYTTHQVVKMVGSDFSQKRLEHLKNLRLIPPPIKVGTGTSGTIGYYPEFVVEHVRWIESEHKNGKSYPDILVTKNGKVEAIEIKCKRMQKAHVIEKDLRKHFGKSLMAGNQPQSSVKELPVGVTLDVTKIDQEIKDVQAELKSLFAESAKGISEIRIAKIKARIERLEELAAMKDAVSRWDGYFGQLKGKKQG